MNTRSRTVLAVLALGVPALLGARSVAIDAARTGEQADNEGGARTRATQGDTVGSIPAHMSGGVIDLWVLWALRHSLVPAAAQVVATDASSNNVQQESQP